jgi:peptidoglycan/xylan/chitin deacetylase (PgdA/CDA1 family)
MRYLVKTPWIIRKIMSSYVWNIDTRERIIYFTFDDGPHPEATPFVLDQLKKYNAKASFFCIGKNVQEYPGIFNRISEEGHSIGNHTQHHLNGWKTKNNDYLDDITEASAHIDSTLFRPPYGRLRSSLARLIPAAMNKKHINIIYWSVLSGDFDTRLTPDQCVKNVTRHGKPGSIVVFHDSEKALPRLQYALPLILEFFAGKNYRFDSLKRAVGDLKV